MEEKNPEKIPLNPINVPVEDKQFYASSDKPQPLSGRDQVMQGMFKRQKQEPAIPLKYKLLLAVMVIVFILIAFMIGKVLFRNGLV